MKKIIKNNIFGFILGVLLTGVAGVFAYSYIADQISYTTSKNENVKSVGQALNDLYDKTDKEILNELTLKMRTTGFNRQSPANTNYMIFNTKLRDYYKFFMITNVSCNNYVNLNNGGYNTYGDNHGTYEILQSNVKYSFSVYSNIWTNVFSTTEGKEAYCDVHIKFYNE